MHKRKAIECSQTSADYKAQLEKCNSQLNDAQQVYCSIRFELHVFFLLLPFFSRNCFCKFPDLNPCDDLVR